MVAEFLPLSEVDSDNPEVLFKDAAAFDQNIMADKSNRTAVDEAASEHLKTPSAGSNAGSKGFFWDDPAESTEGKMPKRDSVLHPDIPPSIADVKLGVVGIYNLRIKNLKKLSSGKDPLSGKNLFMEVTVRGQGEETHSTVPRRKGEDMKYPEVFQVSQSCTAISHEYCGHAMSTVAKRTVATHACMHACMHVCP